MDLTPNSLPKGKCSLDLLSHEVIPASRMIGLHINQWSFIWHNRILHSQTR
jgi:hypothetical protein